MTATPRLRVHRQVLASALGLALLASGAARADEPIKFEIPSQPLVSALRAFTTQSKMQLLYEQDAVRHATANAVVGNYDKREALEKLLLGTGVEITFSGDNAATIRVKSGRGGASNGSISNGIQSAQATSLPTAEEQGGIEQNSQEAKGSQETSSVTSSEVTEMESILVTGTHIRGGAPASPLMVVDQEEIGRAGYASTRDLIQSLPQNAGRELGDNTQNVLGVDATTNGLAASPNLRGLGSSATLVLMNGQRLAPAGVSGGVDISILPLSAIERVEILTDGASATYGSDAVAGVVNFITRDDLSGADTEVQYGTDARGDVEEWRVSQGFGASWATGSLGIIAEYYERSPLKAGDRDISSALLPDQYLNPAQERSSILVFGRQSLSDFISVRGHLLYSEQDKHFEDRTGASFSNDHGANQLSGAANIDIDLPQDWQLTLSGVYGRSEQHRLTIEPLISRVTEGDIDNISRGFEAGVNGKLFALPAGNVRVAAGLGVRSEEFSRSGTVTDSIDASREVFSAYAEAIVPVLSRADGGSLLEISLAGRYEEYDSFGSTANPKFGAVWSPTSEFKLRGTWGTSFHAPEFFDLYGPITALVIPLPDPSAQSGTTLSLGVVGGSPMLQPEESETWTIGFDWTPEALDRLSISVTYFNTAYDNRLAVPCANPFFALADPASCGPAVNRSPGIAFYDQILATSTVFNLSGGAFTSADFGAFVDGRKLNVASTKQDGLDVAAQYEYRIGSVEFGSSVNVAYLFSNEQRLTDTSPTQDLLNRLFSTPDLRVRAGVNARRGALSGALFLNYTTDYKNDLVSPTQTIDRFISIDAQIAWDIASVANSTHPITRIAFSIRNLFDEEPPRVSGNSGFFNGAIYGYDPANADPLGRFFSIRLTHHW